MRSAGPTRRSRCSTLLGLYHISERTASNGTVTWTLHANYYATGVGETSGKTFESMEDVDNVMFTLTPPPYNEEGHYEILSRISKQGSDQVFYISSLNSYTIDVDNRIVV